MDEGIVRLIGELERGAPIVWAGAMRQATLNAIISLLSGVLLIVVPTYLMWRCVLWIRTQEEAGADTLEKAVPRLVVGLLGGTVILMGMVSLGDFLRWAISPELMALRIIMGS